MALHAEAAPLIQALKLKKEPCAFPLYTDANRRLLITGIGIERVASAIGYYGGKFGFTKADRLFNIGTAGSREEKNLHKLFAISKVVSTYDDRVYHLEYDPHIETATLATYPKPVTPSGDIRIELVDMEASALIRTLDTFISLKQLRIYKVVSDNLNPQESKDMIRQSIEPHIDSLQKVLA